MWAAATPRAMRALFTWALVRPSARKSGCNGPTATRAPPTACSPTSSWSSTGRSRRLRTGIRDAEPAPTVSCPVVRTLYLPRRGVLETIFPEALRVAAALVDFVRAILVFGAAFFTGARLAFAGVRFAALAFRFDAVGLAEPRADRDFPFFDGALFVGAAFLAALLACGDGPLAVAARTCAPPDAGTATGAPAAGADAPSPSQHLISARSSPPGLR